MRAYKFIKRFICDFLSFFQSNKVFLVAYVQSDGHNVEHYNWGDDINKFFIESISDLNVKVLGISYIHRLLPITKYSCIGSILGTYNERKLIVWGSGCISDKAVLKQKPYKICSVRGPLTRDVLLQQGISCPERYGDPALLLSRYYIPDVTKKYEIGIIPHYMDEDIPLINKLKKQYPNILIINMKKYGDWHEIPDKICSCKRIVSSSLHGLIVSDSYGIPNMWVRFSNNLKGGAFKFQDYLHSVGRFNVHAYDIVTEDDFMSIVNHGVFCVAPSIDFQDIKDACPFGSHLYDFKYNTDIHGRYS